MGLWCPVCSVDPAPPSPTLRTSFEQSCAPDRPCLALGFVWCALEPRDPGSAPHDLPATLLSAPSCFGRIGDGTYLILGPSPPIDGKERAGSLSLLLASQPGWVCQYSANRYLVTENTLVCVGGGRVECFGISLGTRVSKHITLTCCARGFRFPLLLHQETMRGLRGHGVHPTGTAGPQSVASCCCSRS